MTTTPWYEIPGSTPPVPCETVPVALGLVYKRMPKGKAVTEYIDFIKSDLRNPDEWQLDVLSVNNSDDVIPTFHTLKAF
ncbi:hypothetical protein [Tunturiibacter psychrotolerans]|uniref:hypothetical protein n=1 Tax=Tunturiibacter psychrotolerans TaxID=3069686 RepID=UPI003D22CCD4